MIALKEVFLKEKENYLDDFVENYEEVKAKLDLVNDIIEDFMSGIDEVFEPFTYNEFCRLCSENYSEIIENFNFEMSDDMVLKTSFYEESLSDDNNNEDQTFTKAEEEMSENIKENILLKMEEKLLIKAMKMKCGDNLSKEAEDIIRFDFRGDY